MKRALWKVAEVVDRFGLYANRGRPLDLYDRGPLVSVLF
jgi:hypothetical protein